MSYLFRKAKTTETNELLELVGQALAVYQLSVNPEGIDKDLTDLDKYYFSNKGWFTVLEKEDRIIGSYGIYFMGNGVCELRKMYLLNEFQGKGYGKLLMEDSLNKARELGFEEIILETNKKLDKAISMYLKYGFEPYEPGHLSERCDYAMRKFLI